MNFFKNPDRIYRGTDFWMLNEQLEDSELIYQLDEMSKQGVASVIARTYIGLKSDYPGKDFMAKTRLIIDRAKHNGLRVLLQAGFMPEAVPDIPLKYALGQLRVEKSDVCTEKPLLQKNGYTFYGYYSTNSINALNMFDRESVEHYIKVSYDLWQPFKEEFGKTVHSVWVDEPSYHAEYLPWFNGLDDVFYAEYGYSLAKNVDKLYFECDNYKTVRYHYWTLLQRLLEENYFALVKEWCLKNNLLFSGHLMLEDTMFSQISRACATMPYYKYFDIPGIDMLTGNYGWTHNSMFLKGNQEYINYYKTAMYTTPLQCVCAAHQAGKKHILCEMYGVTSNGMNFKDFEYLFEHFASLGVNHRSVHGLFYSLHGRAKRKFPPHVNYYQPYWEKYKILTDSVARTAAFISQGKPFAKTLVIHPLETAYMYYEGSLGGKQPTPTSDMLSLDSRFAMALRTLLANHLSFELGDINTISKWGSMENGQFILGEMRYQTVVLPFIEVLNKKTAELLKEYARLGGKVIVVGNYPNRIDGILCDTSEYFADADFVSDTGELIEYLKSMGDYYTVRSDKDATAITVYHTQTDKGFHYMLFNNDFRNRCNAELSVNGRFCAYLLNPDNGEATPLKTKVKDETTTVYLAIPEGSGRLVCLEQGGQATANEENLQSLVLELDNCFNFKTLAPNSLVLEYCTYKLETNDSFIGPYTTLAVNRILSDNEYNGELIQRFTFKSELELKGLSLALEDAELCEVYLNGQRAHEHINGNYYFSKDFKVVYLPDSCKKGENVIEIRRNFTPLTKARSAITSLYENQRGTELENMYLLGDFGVYSVSEQTENGSIRFNKNFVLAESKHQVNGELTRRGLPFYCGAIMLSKSFKFSGEFDRVMLEIGDFRACVAEVFVNGVALGNVYRSPYNLDIKKALKQGENLLEIKLYNTLRPILGPYHNPLGELGECWGGGYGDPDGSWVGTGNGDKEWYLHTAGDSDNWTDSYNQPSFGIFDIKIKATTK